MLVCSGLVFIDAFESFTDTRLVAAVVLIIALATLIMGFMCLSPARDRRRGFVPSAIGVLAAAVVGSLLVFNAYGLLLLIPTLLLGLPSILLLMIEARKA